MPTNREMLAEAESRLQSALAERRAISNKVEKEGRKTFTEAEESKFIAVSTLIKEQRERVNELRENIERHEQMSGAADRIWNAANGSGSGYRPEGNVYTSRTAH